MCYIIVEYEIFFRCLQHWFMNELIKIRHHLHAHPELSGRESKTSQFIADYLKDLGIRTITRNISHHSLVAEIAGKEEGLAILFRCELDALPIEEMRRTGYRSQNPGVSHACGHDGHMAIMLGFAQHLLKNPPGKGKVLLLFQSAEETGSGAEAVLDSGFLNNYPVEYAFSMHNMPGYHREDVICRAGNFTPSVESITIELSGKTSHAGEPDKGINPAVTLAKIITFLSEMEEPEKYKKNYFLATPIQIRLGEKALGTSAGYAFVTYTLRTWDNSFLEQKKNEIEERAGKIVKEQRGLDLHLTWSEPFRTNRNHPDAFAIIRKAATANHLNFVKKEEPLTWGEDFGLFTEKYRGAMFGIGAGEKWSALHNPDYNFPDDLIEPGVMMFVSIVEEILH